jgi:hypothetical protein
VTAKPHFPLDGSRMIEIALGVYDTLEVTIGPRSPTKSPIEKWSAFERYKPSYCSVITLDA